MRQKLRTLGKIAGSICCTIVGLCIAGYGVGEFTRSTKKYYVPDTSRDTKENEEQ